MMSIGEFARLGQVSVRMLRHYDAVGVLRPARTDPATGYRSYDPEQLARLHRVVALKDLGFTLEEVSSIIEDLSDAVRLREMWRVRHAELAAEQAATTARLVRVEHRLNLIEQERNMNDVDYILKPLPALRLAAGRTRVTETEQIVSVVEPLFTAAMVSVRGAGGSLRTALALYDADDDGMEVIAGYDVSDLHSPAVDALEITDVDAAERAACAVHLGPMSTIGSTWQALHQALNDNGLTPYGPCRELYLRAEGSNQANWVTELQQPVRA